MSVKKRYYWLKLPADFFRDLRMNKLRRIAGGDTYTIIYQKLMLLSIENGGLLLYQGIENSFVEELAFQIYEEEENISVTLNFMKSQGLIEELSEGEFLLPKVPHMIGSEVDSAERVRNYRKRKKGKMLQSNISETKVKHVGNVETETKESRKDTDTEVELWLIEKSKNAKEPLAYKATMRKALYSDNIDAVSEFNLWKSKQISLINKKEAVKANNMLLNKIKIFDYSQIEGLIIDDKLVLRSYSDEDLSTVDIWFEDNSHSIYQKQDIYQFLNK